MLQTLSSFHCRAELDINTAPERLEQIAGSDLVPVLREFADLAKELLTEGDL